MTSCTRWWPSNLAIGLNIEQQQHRQKHLHIESQFDFQADGDALKSPSFEILFTLVKEI